MIGFSRWPALAVLSAVAFFASPLAARAGEADVVAVTVAKEAGGTYRFSATLRHADTGDEHYADRWEVLAPDGKVLATRVLYHPHVNEQPFTRSLGGVAIPDGIDTVTVRAHDKVHGYGGVKAQAKIPR